MNICPPGSANALTVFGSAKSVNEKFSRYGFERPPGSKLSSSAVQQFLADLLHERLFSRIGIGPAELSCHFAFGRQTHPNFVGFLRHRHALTFAGDLVFISRSPVV